MLAFGAGLWHAPNDVQLTWGANFGPATKDGQWWRLGSAMFLHFGVLHLAMNMWALWDGGRLVERLYGHGRFAFIYLGSGVAGNLLSLVVQGERAVSGGASGAVFGVYGALLVCLARERSRVDPFEFRWLFGGVTVFSVATLALGFVIPGIDNAAHIGGLLAG
ncbi:MAG: rhomboid family intramembrane serine protease, partial [Methylibium sp.]|nr:rhomboid family intramembrane serine protease [Methylibium sp.]